MEGRGEEESREYACLIGFSSYEQEPSNEGKQTSSSCQVGREILGFSANL